MSDSRRSAQVAWSLWREPRPSGAPRRVWRDWALVGALEVTAVLEGLFRQQVELRPVVTVAAMALVLLLLWRRTHPLTCALIGWGVGGAFSVIQIVGNTGDLGLYTTAAIMVLLYSLVRWGSGREIVIGLVAVVVFVVLGMVASAGTRGDAIGGSVFVSTVAAIGAAVRFRAVAWDRQLADIRSQERVGLARELHDTVAHHVSAIAVQAQAGRAVAGQRPDAALTALEAIESEASRTLEEMRAMVRVLREGEVDYAPTPGVSDLSSLVRRGAAPTVEVHVAGPVDQLPRAVDAAVYRLAQESLTNALRHARGATRVEIGVDVDEGWARLSVTDDGHPDPSRPVSPGFGLIGMAERAQLLGGRLQAGPRPEGGWSVSAELPLEVTS
ncbi:MAG: sensor histidine kinase [Nocardioidaceae bacterium]